MRDRKRERERWLLNTEKIQPFLSVITETDKLI